MRTMLTLNDYQEAARTTAVYPSQGSRYGLAYAALGINGEAGEVAEIAKKILRGDFDEDGPGTMEEAVERLSNEIGDVLWYVAQVAWEAGLELDDIARENLLKLRKRQDEGKLKGSGNDR